jgi:hypothetical protein
MMPQTGNFGVTRASSAEEVGITVTRIGATTQPGIARSVVFLTDATQQAIARIQDLLAQTAESVREAFEHQLANLLIILLTPASMLALVFGLWRVSADLGWTEDFVITSGLFSHWQVWIALALALKFAGTSLQARMSPVTKSSPEN